MIYKHKSNRKVDIGEAIPNLHIDLEKAVETHTIRDTGVIPEFNAIESTDEVGPIVKDTFMAIDEKNRLSQLMRDTMQVQSQTQQQQNLTQTQQSSTTQTE